MSNSEAIVNLTLQQRATAFPEPLHVGRPNIGSRIDFLDRVNRMLDDKWLTNNGPFVQELEQKVASLHGVRHCVAVCNGTIALEIAIKALGLSGEVIVPSYTFIATAHALSWQGITPIFADIDPATHNIDPASVIKRITPKTTAIIGVHLWGRPAPVEELEQIASDHGLELIFDAAHAFGCSLKGKKIGNFGRCEILSFHATKIFNTFEGGAILTNEDELAETVRLMRNFGFAGLDNVIHPGTNGKMSEINAAMGLTNFESLTNFVEANRLRYNAYKENLKNLEHINIIQHLEENSPNYHYIVIEAKRGLRERDKIISGLHKENVLARKYFWPGCHNMEPYISKVQNQGSELQETTKIANRVIVLPSGQNLTMTDVEKVSELIATLASQ